MNMKKYCTCMNFQPNSFTGNCSFCNYPKKQLDSKIDLKGFKPPKNNIEELLLHLILEKEISLFDFPYLVSYRSRISDLQLKYGLFLERKFETKTNKYGNSYTYAIHSLPESEKQKAVQLYKNLNSN